MKNLHIQILGVELETLVEVADRPGDVGEAAVRHGLDCSGV
jgi:hypothetical protein